MDEGGGEFGFLDCWWFKSPYKLTIPATMPGVTNPDGTPKKGHKLRIEQDQTGAWQAKVDYYLQDDRDAMEFQVDLLDGYFDLVASAGFLRTVNVPHLDQHLYTFTDRDPDYLYKAVFTAEDSHGPEYRDHCNKRMLTVNDERTGNKGNVWVLFGYCEVDHPIHRTHAQVIAGLLNNGKTTKLLGKLWTAGYTVNGCQRGEYLQAFYELNAEGRPVSVKVCDRTGLVQKLKAADTKAVWWNSHGWVECRDIQGDDPPNPACTELMSRVWPISGGRMWVDDWVTAIEESARQGDAKRLKGLWVNSCGQQDPKKWWHLFCSSCTNCGAHLCGQIHPTDPGAAGDPTDDWLAHSYDSFVPRRDCATSETNRTGGKGICRTGYRAPDGQVLYHHEGRPCDLAGIERLWTLEKECGQDYGVDDLLWPAVWDRLVCRRSDLTVYIEADLMNPPLGSYRGFCSSLGVDYGD
ncbi:MAG: hypothetical protein COZ06_19505 [Armatimonadetes bacterium CG_4_10_14_3_um_filter_66_18]|nr:MAG: hypothetical protein COZ06_19505 [Armatimonadetes bacterium CG_4_10_14_3_um_filter_66_18]